MVEVSIKVSNSNQSLTKKEIDYSKSITISQDDHILKNWVGNAVKEFKGTDEKDVEDVVLKFKMVWQ
jgi:hypothetical protein